MKNTMILAGAAALAFTAPVLAQPGKGGGGGNGNGGGKGGPPAQVQKGGGGGGGGGPQMRGNGGGGGPKEMRGGGGPQREARGGGGGGGPKEMRGGGGPQREARGGGGPQMRGPERREARQMERPQQQMKQRGGPIREARDDRGPGKAWKGNGNREIRVAQDRGAERGDRQFVQRGERIQTNVWNSPQQRVTYLASPTFRTTGLIDGCPPGLAAKGNGCLPPGQAKKLVGYAAPEMLGSALLPVDYRNWYPDNDDYYYRTYDDYVYRIDRDRNYVDAYWPMANDWNGAYYVGSAYPQDYLGYYNVPVQYQPWYADNGDDYYRYGDGAIYQVDRGNGLIEGIVSLLAGGFGVGQPMPAGYDVYNVPYDYRDRYVDSADHMYRYNDGYIYDVDPTTQIVQAIVETLV